MPKDLPPFHFSPSALLKQIACFCPVGPIKSLPVIFLPTLPHTHLRDSHPRACNFKRQPRLLLAMTLCVCKATQEVESEHVLRVSCSPLKDARAAENYIRLISYLRIKPAQTSLREQHKRSSRQTGARDAAASKKKERPKSFLSRPPRFALPNPGLKQGLAFPETDEDPSWKWPVHQNPEVLWVF